MSDLVLCSGCSRHVRAHESACPFCRVVRAPSRAAALLAGALLAGALSQGGDAHAQLLGPRETMQHAPAQGYGAPPSFDPMRIYREPAPAPAPAPPIDPTRLRTRVVVTPRAPVAAAPMLSALSSRRVALTRCLERADPQPPASASLRVEFDLTPAGRVEGVRVDDGHFGGADRCVQNALRPLRVRLSAPLAASVHVAVTVSIDAPPPPPRTVRRGPIGAPSGANLCAHANVERGCRRTGCSDGMVCDTRVSCVPSSCGCDPSTGNVTCTADCGGGVCVPANRRAPGDPLGL